MNVGNEEGIVIEIQEQYAVVKAMRHGDCKNCGACPSDDATVMKVQNPLGAKPGQKVIFEMQQSNMLKAAFIVYLLPLIALFLGLGLGYSIAVYWQLSTILCQVVATLISMGLSGVAIKHFDKKTASNTDSLPIITHILL